MRQYQIKKMFSEVAETNRCAVYVDGYYEWKDAVLLADEVPWYVRRKPPVEGEALKSMILAGLYFQVADRAKFGTDDYYSNQVVLLTQPSAKCALSDIGERMPVFLNENTVGLWLDTTTYKFADCQDFLHTSAVPSWIEAFVVPDAESDPNSHGPKTEEEAKEP